jgi:hypothetical protein
MVFSLFFDKVKSVVRKPLCELALRTLECANSPNKPNLIHFVPWMKCW